MRFVLAQLRNMREKWYKPPKTHKMKKVDFVLTSLKRSAMDEIILFLMRNENDDPVETVELFCRNMDNAACYAKTPDSKLLFSVYYDIGMNVLDLLLGFRERGHV